MRETKESIALLLSMLAGFAAFLPFHLVPQSTLGFFVGARVSGGDFWRYLALNTIVQYLAQYGIPTDRPTGIFWRTFAAVWISYGIGWLLRKSINPLGIAAAAAVASVQSYVLVYQGWPAWRPAFAQVLATDLLGAALWFGTHALLRKAIARSEAATVQPI